MMLETIGDNYQILSSPTHVWVNSESGICTGRFSPTGVDIHHDFAGQMKLGIECIDCFAPSGSFDEDWKRFADGMKQHYGVEIDDAHKPTDRAAYGRMFGVSLSAH